MHYHESLWWIFPLVCFGMMLLFSFGFARRGWCLLAKQRKSAGERIQKLEEEIQSLKQSLTKERMTKEVYNAPDAAL